MSRLLDVPARWWAGRRDLRLARTTERAVRRALATAPTIECAHEIVAMCSRDADFG